MARPVAIVTGASAGLGRALADELAEQGYAVGLIARREGPLREACHDLHERGHTVACAVADVTNREALQRAVSDLAGALGAIDLAIANAGVGLPDRLDPFDVDVVEQTFAVNLMGVINVIAAVLPGMRQRGAGHIVGISSLGADRGMPGSAAYGASKAALNAYLEGLRVSLRPEGIAVTTVCPGFIRTAMTAQNDFQMPGLMEPQQAARRVVRGLSRRPAVIRFPLSMSLLMRVLRLMPDAVLGRLLPRSGGGTAADSTGSRTAT
jgi:short-subunit dehydrogenase